MIPETSTSKKVKILDYSTMGMDDHTVFVVWTTSYFLTNFSL